MPAVLICLYAFLGICLSYIREDIFACFIHCCNLIVQKSTRHIGVAHKDFLNKQMMGLLDQDIR